MNLRVGQTQLLQATATYSDGTTQTVNQMTVFVSSDPGVADVSNAGQRGQVTGIAAGTATITATYMGRTATATVNVSAARLTGISVSPASARILVGQNQQFQAIALFEDGTSQPVTNLALWSSSDTAVAQISNAGGGGGVPRGTATGLSPGTTTISASYMGFVDSATLTVTAPKLLALSISPLSQVLSVGQTLQYLAIAVYEDGTSQNVTGATNWSSSNTQVAIISNGGAGGGGGRGLATAVSAGTTTISGTYMGLSATAMLTVTAAKLSRLSVSPMGTSLNVGQIQQFTATAIYEDGLTQNVTFQATWASSNQTVASVSNSDATRGQAVALSPGMAAITATYMGLTGSGVITVP
jgi:uncharacterized protein YjdB